MLSKFKSTEGYEDFDGLMRRVESGPSVSAANLSGYDRMAVRRRLAQRLMEVMSSAYVVAAARHCDAGNVGPLSREAVVKCAGLKVIPASGAVIPGVRLFMRSFAEFGFHWLHVLAVYLLATFRGAASRGAATLLFGVGIGDLKRDGSDARFVEYCRRGPIAPLAQARRIIAQATAEVQATCPDSIRYGRFPLHMLASENGLAPAGFVRFMKRHLLACSGYIASLWRCPAMVLLGRDVAYHAMAIDLHARKLVQAIVITNSNYLAQPLWMIDIPDRTYKTHMVWYSTNSLPIMGRHDARQVHLPSSRHIRADEAWVWNDWHSRMLKSFGIDGKTHVVGPILWYVQTTPVSSERKDGICVAVFDVTPLTMKAASGQGLTDNYYTAGNMMRFLDDIIRACDAAEAAVGIPTKVLLKHKRSYLAVHDQRYIDAVKRLLDRDRRVQLVPSDTDIYSLISSADISVVIPYSSPAYVADHLGRPAVFYDPTAQVMPNYDGSGTVTLVAGPDKLVEVMVELATARAAAALPSEGRNPVTAEGK